MNLAAMRQDLDTLKNREVIVFGSQAAGEATVRSDIDVAVLARTRDRKAAARVWDEVLGRAPDRYDIRVFELLPLEIQADIARSHVVAFGDPVEISAYFYPVLKQWQDTKHRYERPLPPRERLARLTR
jgi:uncharacterized protein